MANIYRFPGGEGARHEIIEEIGGDGEQPIPLVVRIILNTIGGVLAVVAGVAVMLLFFVRWPLHIVCNLISGMGFLVAVFGWMVSKPDIMWTALAMSLGAFAIRWCYDLVLIWLTDR
jgi:hypothetical protein